MFRKIIKPLKWLFILSLIWIVYLLVTIFNYPEGKLSDTADAAIVLGAAVYGSKPSPVFAERINHAINLYQAGNIKKLIFTGGTRDENTPTESSVARDYAISKNVKDSDIFIETSSLTTKENLIYAQTIINREKLNTILIISDALHLKRAVRIAHDLHINAKASATPTSRYQSVKTRLPFALRELYFYHHYLLFSE